MGAACLDGILRPIPTKCLFDSKMGSEEQALLGTVEACVDGDLNLDLPDRENSSPVPESNGAGTGAKKSVRGRGAHEAEGGNFRKKKRWGVDDDIVAEILRMLNEVIISPPSKIMDTHHWEDNIELQNLPPNDKDVVQAFRRWNRKLCRWSIRDYIEFYRDPSREYLFQDIHDSKKMYYSVEDSVKHVDNFLIHSFGDQAKHFLQTLVNVVDRRFPKKNTLEVICPPSTGKTWFFDMIVDFFINVGHLKNMNKNSQFPFQDCNSRRIILWNEPNCHEEFQDTLKTIYGGDRCPAAQKCVDDVVIYRTPVIVTSNKPIFPHCEALNARRFNFQLIMWDDLLYLADFKPHPLCIEPLLEKYKIEY